LVYARGIARGRGSRFGRFEGRWGRVGGWRSDSGSASRPGATCSFSLAFEFEVESPFDGAADLFECIHTHAVPSSSNGNQHTSFLHDNHTLEGYSSNQCIWLGSWGSIEGQDIEALAVAEQQIVRGQKGAAGRGHGILGGGEIRGDNRELEAEF
jgi:hypothetical protein